MKLKDRDITYEFGGRTEVIAIDMGDKVCWVEKEKYEKDPLLMLYLEKIKIEKEIMENKYYVPEISEFHVGFEYEITTGYEWVKKTFSHKDFNTFLYQHLDNAIKQEYIRVKYLDKSDIEELGWTDYEPPFEYNHKWKLGKWELNAWFNREMPSVRIQKYPIFFQGIIKNKSELKKLMKQLDIC